MVPSSSSAVDLSARPGARHGSTTPSPSGWAPSTECGFECSRRTRASSSLVGDGHRLLLSSRLIPATGNRHPVGAVVELVVELVERLLELEDREQVLRSPPRRRAAAPGRRSRSSARGSARARRSSNSGGRFGRAAARPPRSRRRTSAACPATSRSGERLRRRSGSGRAGLALEVEIIQPSGVCSVWPRW